MTYRKKRKTDNKANIKYIFPKSFFYERRNEMQKNDIYGISNKYLKIEHIAK